MFDPKLMLKEFLGGHGMPPGYKVCPISSFGYNLDGGLNFLDVDLKNKRVKPMEVLMSYPFLRDLWSEGFKGIKDEDLSVDNVPISLRTGLLYYTPSYPDELSMLPFVIKDFLPKEMGQMIMLPPEITVKTGMDYYDMMDRFVVMLPYYEISPNKKDIREIKYDYDKSPEENTRKQRENALLEVMYAVLTHIETLPELLRSAGKRR